MNSVKSPKSRRGFIVNFVLPVVCAYLAFSVYQNYSAASLMRFYPFALLLTPYREENLKAWESYAAVNTDVVYPPRPIAEINASGMRDAYL